MNPTFKILPLALTLALATAGPSLAARPNLAPPPGTPMAVTHLNPNSATAAQLTAAKVPAALARQIVAKRPYKTQADFAKLVAANSAEADRPNIYAAVFVPIDLNTGTPEEMLTIPGMSNRMVHEFEEYRPYKDMSQFDREIGKYVDAGEVARLHSYVTIR